MRKVLPSVGILLLTASAIAAAGPSDQPVPADSPLIQYLGAWEKGSNECYTVYPGSQFRFRLKGRAQLWLRSGLPQSIRVAVRQEGRVAWDGILHGPLEVDSGATTQSFSVVYLAANTRGFDPGQSGAEGAEFRFQGMSLSDAAVLFPPAPLRQDLVLEFVGDSITAGLELQGQRSSLTNTDASLTYAFRLAEKLDVSYWIRGYPGESSSGTSSKIPFFRKDVPIHDWHPSLVFVNIGANDRAMSDSRYRRNMQELLTAIFQTHREARVLLLNFFRIRPDRFPVLQDLAREYGDGRVLCFDARRYLVGYNDHGVHPDAVSHSKLAEALEGYVRQMFPATTTEMQNPGQ